MSETYTNPESEVSLNVVKDDQTKAGNYFVSNYPPFSFWSPDHVPALEEAFDTPPRRCADLGQYVHIPFCRKRCHFCYFKVYTGKNKDEITDYLDAVIDELNRYASRPVIEGRKPRFVYFGGGTPSYLSDKQLAYFFEGLQRSLSWDAAEEITFECEPGTLNEKKLKFLADAGITRLSLGIENFDDEILQNNNRAHLSKQVYKAYDYARSVGFPQINIDLIAGMLGETDENWQRNIDKTLELAPDCVTIYQMEIPYNTTIYQDMKEQGKDVAPVADWQTKRRWVSEAFDQFEQAGYTVTSAYTAVKDPEIEFLYRDALWTGADMLGVGVSSFGIINGVHYQNQADIVPYVSAVAGGESPVYRALPMKGDEPWLRQFILQFKLGRVGKQHFVEQFGVDPFARFADTLKQYEKQGWLHLRDDAIELTRDGLLQVDSMLHAFFLPEHQDARYT